MHIRDGNDGSAEKDSHVAVPLQTQCQKKLGFFKPARTAEESQAAGMQLRGSLQQNWKDKVS